MPAIFGVLQDGSFWPNEAGSWFALLASFVALVGGIGSLLYRIGQLQQKLELQIADNRAHIDDVFLRQNEKFKEHGERMGKSEKDCAAHGASLTAIHQIDTQHTLEISTNSRELGRVDGRITEVDKTARQILHDNMRVEALYRERLARIEERLRISPREEL